MLQTKRILKMTERAMLAASVCESIYLSYKSYFFYQLRPCLVPKKFQDSPSHRFLRHMHGVLNLDENKN